MSLIVKFDRYDLHANHQLVERNGIPLQDREVVVELGS
jgi:hypothetical protein